MKILIVDDEDMQRDLLKGFLKKKGYEVMTAENGRQALQRFLEPPFQLVILEHKMPDITGDEVLAQDESREPHRRCYHDYCLSVSVR